MKKSKTNYNDLRGFIDWGDGVHSIQFATMEDFYDLIVHRSKGAWDLPSNWAAA